VDGNNLMPITPYFDYRQSLAAAWEVWGGSLVDRDAMQRLAQQRLTELQTFARANSPFYQRLYQGLDSNECRLTSLPPITRADLVSHFDDLVTDPEVTRARLEAFLENHSAVGAPFLGRYAVWTSSGTTGEPSVLLHDGRALAIYDALQLQRFRATNPPRFNDRYAMVGATGNHFAGVASFERLRHLQPWLADRLRIFSLLEPIGTLTNALNDYQPTLLATYATAAGLLAEEQTCERLAIAPQEVWVGGECLSVGDRLRIERAFGCRVRNEYAASEFLSIAWDCEHELLHANTDWVLLEAVDAHGRVVPPGTASHTTLITNLANRVLPLIRFDLGDSITWLEEPCSCGSRFPTLRVEGRCDEALVLSNSDGRSAKLLPLALTTVLEDEATVYRFQLHQVGPDAVALDLDPTCDNDAPKRCRTALKRYLSGQGLPKVRITIRRRPLRPHPVSGKLQRVLRRAAAHRSPA